MYIELKTDRLRLRPLGCADLEAVHAYAGDPENARYMMFLPKESKTETARELRYALHQPTSCTDAIA